MLRSSSRSLSSLALMLHFSFKTSNTFKLVNQISVTNLVLLNRINDLVYRVISSCLLLLLLNLKNDSNFSLNYLKRVLSAKFCLLRLLPSNVKHQLRKKFNNRDGIKIAFHSLSCFRSLSEIFVEHGQ